MPQLDHEDLVSRFSYHAPRVGTAAVHQIIRAEAFDLAAKLVALTKPCREQSLAITALEEVTFWANAAIARHGIIE